MNKQKKVVLAYSGGLDTTVICHWLAAQGYDVTCVLVDLGQCDRYGRGEDFSVLSQRAINAGASRCVVRDAKRDFVRDGVFQCLKADAKYEGQYLLGTSIARPFIMREAVSVAKEVGTRLIAHGATGKGNDQCRFELSAYALMPEAKLLAPWREERFWRAMHGKRIPPGRKELIAYAKKYQLAVEATEERPFSTDANIAHMSHEAGVLEDPNTPFPHDVHQMTSELRHSRSDTDELVIWFQRGVPICADADFLSRKAVPADPVAVLQFLNERGKLYGIQPVDMVENRYVGMKSRGVYEAPGMTILYAAHRWLEGLCMDGSLMHLRDMLSPKYAELVYNGYWFSPLMEALNAFVDVSQKEVTGRVTVRLERGHVKVIGRISPYSLYDESIASMEKGGEFNPKDAAGFLKIVGLPVKMAAQVKNR